MKSKLAEQITVAFRINAGRYDGNEKNYKYCDYADNLPEALRKYQDTYGYDFRELDMLIECDGVQSRIPMLGGDDEATMMRMEMADLWCKTTEHQFVDVAMPWQQQIEDIVDEVKRLRAELRLCHSQSDRHMQRIRELEPLPWQVVHLGFLRGELGWTQSFDALMSQCGMPMEEALKCLAEHFDRRPAIQETEVAA